MDIKLTCYMVSEGLKEANLNENNSIFAWHMKRCAYFPNLISKVEKYVESWKTLYDTPQILDEEFDRFKQAINKRFFA